MPTVLGLDVLECLHGGVLFGRGRNMWLVQSDAHCLTW